MNLTDLGFFIKNDFISSEEENDLLSYISKNSKAKKGIIRNSIKRYGPAIPYKGNIVSKEIPDNFNFLLNRLVSENLLNTKPESITINEYFKGQGIAPHIDNKESGKIISILSLMSNAVMIFQKNKEKIIVELPQRSLIQLKNEIRNNWQHSISPVKDTRYSIVFRCSKDEI